MNKLNVYLKKAYEEALKAYAKKEVPVGAVIVKEGKIIARAHNLRETKKNALAHAEIMCINKACKKLGSWRLDGCEMYVTLLPCQMCLGAIKQSRIQKVYYGATDSKKIEPDIAEENEICELMYSNECSKILKDFFQELRNK